MCVELAAVGAGLGLFTAVRELAQQRYLAQGLWRTALWDAERLAIGGGALSLAAGLVLLAVVWLSQRIPRTTGAPALNERVFGHAVFLAFLAGVAMFGSPQQGGHGVGIPYRVLVAISYAALWAALACVIAVTIRRPAAGQDEDWFGLRWLSVVGIGFVVVFLHLWTRGFRPVYLTLISAGALFVCAAAYFALARPARFAHDRLRIPLGRLLAGPVGRALSVLVLLAAVGLGGAGYVVGSQARAAARARGRNVILIGIDTIRADRASLRSANERGRDLTPNLRRLAERGTVFTNAIAQSSWTLPSFASMLTGLYPEQHGAEHLTSTLAPAQVTLAELLREAGYHTMSVVSCEYLNAASGMGQGFEVLDESQVRGHRAVTSREITDRAISLLESNGARPLFLFAHYFDPHFCYRDHQEFDFGAWYQGRLRDAVQNADQNAFCWLIGAIGPAFADRSRATDEDRRFLRDAYDGEVAFTDAQLGRLLDYIERRRLWDSTMVIAVGDHGEELLERNYSGHSTTLYREQIDVPLVIAAPGVRHSVDPEPAEARAIFPTICDFLNVPARANATPANSLLAQPRAGALVRSSTRPVAEPPRPEEFVPKYVWLTCATDGRWKLIKDHLRDRAALYDLRSDPGETRDRSADNQEQRRKLESALDELDARAGLDRKTAGRTEADQQQQRRLKSLGYL